MFFEFVSFETSKLPISTARWGLFVNLPNFYGLFFQYFYGVSVDFPRRSRQKGKFSNTKTTATSRAYPSR